MKSTANEAVHYVHVYARTVHAMHINEHACSKATAHEKGDTARRGREEVVVTAGRRLGGMAWPCHVGC